MAELFRRNAGVIVFNKHKNVLLCRRNDVKNAWQFPQGGIEEGENPSEAAKRELQEETSITSVVLVKTLSDGVRYYFPQNILQAMKAKGFNNVGQEMFWSLFYFTGEDSEINLKTAQPEFDIYRWVTLREACDLIVDFKKNAYKKAADEFEKIISDY